MGKKYNKDRKYINDDIYAKEMRLIDENGAQVGIVSKEEALEKAKVAGLDLVQIADTATPPVCKIMDYGKFLFIERKKKKDAKKKQKIIHIKEIKFRPKTDIHDYDFKKKHIIDFLLAGDKVKVTVRYRGREMAYQNIGRDMLLKIKEDIKEYGEVEKDPKMEGRNMFMMLTPKKNNKKIDKGE